ncbi:50S ribosomal protein L15 [Candidatus Wolfebacteria bacterium]|nr:50S ribosomal protein L15 [Candidatus Wolfebacteria bacterium]
MELFKDSKNKNKKLKRIARGGKRGVTSGRGQKGQSSRAGNRRRPAERDLLIRLPKLRGYKNNSIRERTRALTLTDLSKYKEEVLTPKELGNVKVVGTGELKKKVTLKGVKVSKTALELIKKAGGKVE